MCHYEASDRIVNYNVLAVKYRYWLYLIGRYSEEINYGRRVKDGEGNSYGWRVKDGEAVSSGNRASCGERSMNLRLLKIFRAVMQTQTTIGAARELGISQPAVSNAIRQFEKQLNLKLFERFGNRIVPTQEATILFHESESIFLLSKELGRTVVDLQEKRIGSIKIVATPQLGHTIIPSAIKDLLKNRPKVKVNFDVRQSHYVIEAIQAGAADIGFAIGLEKELRQQLDLMELQSVGMVCLMQKDHELTKHKTLTPNEIKGHTLIGLEMGSRLGPLILNAFREYGVPYQSSIEVRYSETACLLAGIGAGIAIVDGFTALAKDRFGDDLVAIPFHPLSTVQASAIFPKYRPISQLTLAFAEHIKTAIRREFPR